MASWELVAQHSGATVPDSHGVPAIPSWSQGISHAPPFKEHTPSSYSKTSLKASKTLSRRKELQPSTQSSSEKSAESLEGKIFEKRKRQINGMVAADGKIEERNFCGGLRTSHPTFPWAFERESKGRTRCSHRTEKWIRTSSSLPPKPAVFPFARHHASQYDENQKDRLIPRPFFRPGSSLHFPNSMSFPFKDNGFPSCGLMPACKRSCAGGAIRHSLDSKGWRSAFSVSKEAVGR